MATLALPVRPQGRSIRSPYGWISNNPVNDLYLKLLLFLSPIQSVLITSVQGTTPAFVLTLVAGVAMIDADRRYLRVLAFYAAFLVIYSLYLSLSLSGLLIDQPDTSQLTVIRDVYIYGELRQTHITQGLYLMTALLFAFLVYTYYQEAFLKWAFYGILALAAYGFYEFIYYALLQANGDFLSNRNFGDLEAAAAGAAQDMTYSSGAVVQQSNLFGSGFMRLKSLVAEPSMYALTVTPFAVYAFARGWRLIFGVLLLSLVLSTSSTAVLGLAVGISYIQVRQRQEFLLYIGAFLLVAGLLYATAEPVTNAVDTLLFEKLDTRSGSERLTSFIAHAGVVLDGNPMRALFGLGFGTVRATDMMSNLLANIGLLGFLLYSVAILMPCLRLGPGRDHAAVVATLLSIYVMEVLTVSEYAYLPPWFMVALGYARLREQGSVYRARALRAPVSA